MTRALRGRELGGQWELEGGKAEGVTELKEDEHQGHDRSAGDASASCDRSWEAKILSLLFGNAARACAGMDLVGKWACPTDARSSVPHSCAA